MRQQPIISVHIPKTGGVSFRNTLREYFGNAYAQMYWDVITDCRGRVLQEFPAQVACIHGHFVAADLRRRFPQGPLVTWVRDPVERVVSAYHYLRREPDWQNELCRALHERRLGLLEYAELDCARNEMARFLGGVPVAQFDFIGVMEDYPRSLNRFRQHFSLGPMPLRRDNTNPSRPADSYYELSARDRDYLLELNRLDAEIYEQGVCLARSGQPRVE